MRNNIVISQIIGISWERMKNLLFRPFSLRKWFILGFCAYVIAAGAPNIGGGLNIPSEVHKSFTAGSESWTRINYLLNSGDGSFFSRLAEVFNISTVLFVGIFVFIIFVVLAVTGLIILFAWLRFRFEFIFLDNLVHNRTEIAAPWQRFKTYANSLWTGYLLILLIVCVVNIFLFLPLFLVWAGHWLKRSAAAAQLMSPESFEFFTLLFIVILFIAWNMAFMLWHFFMVNFQIPVMYKKQAMFRESSIIAWRLASNSPGVFVKFLLFRILIDVIFGICLMFGILFSCCILLVLLIIPVVGTTALMPYLALKRYMGADLLAALTPELDLFATDNGESVEPSSNA